VRALAIAILLSLADIAGAQAQNEGDPVAFVQAIYRDYQDGHPTGWPDRAYSSRLHKLVEEDRKNTPQGDVGRLDFDPYINGQDWKLASLQVAQVSRQSDRAVVEARFQNEGTAEDLRYSLVRVGGRWLVDDVESLTKPRWTLSKILAGAPDAFPDDPPPK
jgi:hypothetical protein